MKSFYIFLILIFVSSVQIFAQLEGNPENMCRNGFFPRESEKYSIAKVKAKSNEKVFFYGDDDDCPNGKNCRLKSYLIAGNEVIVSRKLGNFACVWYQPVKGSETVGWIELKNLVFPETVDSIGKEAWVGKWRFYDNTIEITETTEKNVYQISGEAFWKGLGDNIHIGELDGAGRLVNTKLEYGADDEGEYACRATMQKVGAFLIVADNLNCGGANVTFSGVYRREVTKMKSLVCRRKKNPEGP